MSVVIYSTNLHSERTRTIYPANAIWVCGHRIQIKDRSLAQVQQDLIQLIKVLRKTHYDWLMGRNKSTHDPKRTNTFYVEMDADSGENMVPVDLQCIRYSNS